MCAPGFVPSILHAVPLACLRFKETSAPSSSRFSVAHILCVTRVGIFSGLQVMFFASVFSASSFTLRRSLVNLRFAYEPFTVEVFC